MQDRYVGDVGDFGKYGLLRALSATGKSRRTLTLGIVWYLAPEEDHNDDGKHTSYVRHHSAENLHVYRSCDPDLYDGIWGIFERDKRSVASVQDSELLPEGTEFHDERLSFDGMHAYGPQAREIRLAYRAAWLSRGLDRTRGCTLVFFDPDNGLEVKVGAHTKKGPKYTYYDELVPFYERGQSLVIYQHIHRKRGETAQLQIGQRFTEIRERIGCDDAFALLYHRGTARAFFVVPSDSDIRQLLLERSQNLVAGLWGQNGHFDPVIQPG
ncbi:MAG: hypothetical protein IH985_04910 [Planctomycetes bacterium]|nr:hypothetical protein [Planctomycetota bacterium]